MSAQPQHMQALDQANRVRLERAVLKRAIGENDRALLRMLDEPPECVMSASIMEMLKAQRGWGRTRALKLLDRCGLRESRKIEDMTTRQRQAVSADLERRRV